MYKLYLLLNMIYIFLISNNHNILTVKYEPMLPKEKILCEMLLANGFINNRDSRLTNRDSNRDLSLEVQNLQIEIQNLQMEIQDLRWMHNQYLGLNMINMNV